MMEVQTIQLVADCGSITLLNLQQWGLPVVHGRYRESLNFKDVIVNTDADNQYRAEDTQN